MFTHSGRLERWLGTEKVELLSSAMVDWYGPPIAIAGIPGNVWAMPGGDFRGPIASGGFVNAIDFAEQRLKRAWRNWTERSKYQMHSGFASLSDLIAEATAGKRYFFPFQKTGFTGVLGVTNSLWQAAGYPSSGTAATTAAGGRVLTDASVGAMPFTNPASPDTMHFTVGYPLASVINNTLLLYDRLFDVNKIIATTAVEAVTGVPTRYQSTVSTAADYIGGNFLHIAVGNTALAATAHIWTSSCVYRDQTGTTSAMPAVTGNASAIVHRLDQPVGQWFVPLQNGDVGVGSLVSMNHSVAVATGVIEFVIGHPITFMPCPIANMVCVADGINTAFSLVRIFDDACLTFLDICKPATGATNYAGSFEAVAG